ncbi:MAG: glutamate--tRNA ligase [Terriglobia bacterium]|jgi:glutamyl-tRNA synthetase/nondiscriminating glutamyl-tRNA synthetase
MPSVRVRFAPSPTGYVHVGNARTALFNWLFARHHSGAFVLRIEDTDIERSEERYETQLLADLRWLGLDWDEGPDKPEGGGPFGPYRQSQRKELYARFATELIDNGHAYHCFCSAEQLEAERQADLKAGRQPKYSGRCRKLLRVEVARRLAAGELASIRLKIEASAFTWHDLVHGPTTFSSEVIGDPILVRSDGHPAYNYAVVIDDHLMEITHVIRGDDHISNTPRQLALYQAFGWEPPAFAHLSTILGPDRTRLSKRHGATSLAEFRKKAILPEALRNYLLLLGWSHPDGKTEKLSKEEMIALFSLERVNKSPATFDMAKLEWLNWEYLAAGNLDREGRLRVFRPPFEDFLTSNDFLGPDEIEHARELTDRLLQIYWDSKGRTTYQEIAKLVFGYDAQNVVSTEETRHVAEEQAPREVLASFIPKVLAETDLSYERFREIAKSAQKETGKKGKDLFHPIRVAATGAVSGPELEKLIPIFEEGAKLSLARPVKSTAQRLREFAEAASIGF